MTVMRFGSIGIAERKEKNDRICFFSLRPSHQLWLSFHFWTGFFFLESSFSLGALFPWKHIAPSEALLEHLYYTINYIMTWIR